LWKIKETRKKYKEKSCGEEKKQEEKDKGARRQVC
jgi:hypothetical protein